MLRIRSLLCYVLVLAMYTGSAWSAQTSTDVGATANECKRKWQVRILYDCFTYTICDRDPVTQPHLCFLDEARTQYNPNHTASTNVFIWQCGRPYQDNAECRAIHDGLFK